MADDPTPARAIPDEPDADDGATRAPKRARKRLRDRWLLLGTVGLLVALLLAGVFIAARYLYAVQSAMGKVNHQSLLPSSSISATAQPGRLAPVTFLLLGSDSRDLKVEQGRSDSLMLAQLSGDRKTISLVSIPRDLWVNVPGHGDSKINAAYSWGGAPLAVQTVQSVLQVPIDHVVITNFDSFMSVIDTLGGVDVYNAQASTMEGHHFEQGTIHLNGSDALLYCRNRYDLANGDLDRAGRQRDVLKAIVEKLVSRGTLSDTGKFSAAVNEIAPKLTVDNQLTTGEMNNLGLSVAQRTTKPAIQELQAPIAGFGTSADGQSYDAPDPAGLQELATALRDDDMVNYYAKHRNDPPAGKR